MMERHSGKRNKNFWEAVKCALRGIRSAFTTERNFFRYFFIAMFFLAVNLLLRVPLIAHVIAVVTIAITFAIEILNTAIERICDGESQEIREDIRVIKDLAAGAVLMSSLSFFISEIIFIVQALIRIFTGGQG